jgi:hypothetical protein
VSRRILRHDEPIAVTEDAFGNDMGGSFDGNHIDSCMIETLVTVVALLVAIAQWLFGDQVVLRVLPFKKP